MTPKRKRNYTDAKDHGSTPVALGIEQSPTLREADSPRTQVAERFENLDIARNATGAGIRHQSPSSLAAARKRMKREGDERIQTPEGSPTKRRRKFDEVAETPGAYYKDRSSPPASPAQLDALPTDSTSRPRDSTTPPRPTPPASPSRTTSSLGLGIDMDRANTPLGTPTTQRLSTLNSSSSPQSSPDGEPSSSPTALTWQDEEITGHEIDTSADDDGEGINGIGFKPTAAMAEARSARRKEQVNQWRAREARDARQRRIEKRKGSGGSFSGRTKSDVNGSGRKRAVRFLDGD